MARRHRKDIVKRKQNQHDDRGKPQAKGLKPKTLEDSAGVQKKKHCAS